MGGLPSTPQQETAEYLIAAFVGEKSFPLASDYWQKLLELQLDLRWPSDRVREACHLFAINNCDTKHLAKILIHLAWCLQECVSASGVESPAFSKALNALFLSSTFLKNLIESAASDNFEELYLFLDETELIPNKFSKGENVADLVIYSVLNFIAKVDVRPGIYLLHHELLNFLLIAMSTQLLAGPSPGPNDKHPFIDAAMTQESSLVDLVVNKLLLNYIIQPRVPLSNLLYSMFSESNQLGVLRRVGSAAASLMLLPLNYLVSSNGEALRSPLAESSLNVLLILIHYRKCMSEPSPKDKGDDCNSESLCKEDCLPEEETYFSENPFCKAVENVRDIEFSHTDVEGNAHDDLIVRLPFASLFDTLGRCLADETSLLLLYSLMHGNSYFLEYVLVRTDLDTLLMPMLETLYNAPRRTANHIYMVLIVLLMLSQDSSFNTSIHKLMLPNVPWYQERRLHQTSLGSLIIIILVRTVKYNLSKLRDVYLHTNCLATLANMAPYVHRLSAYASQQLVSLFDMLSRKYNKLAELKNDKMNITDGVLSGDNFLEDPLTELHIYADFLRLVLEILNSILTYALPKNPEVVYAIMHRQEVLLPFKNHPRFSELLDNIYTVLNFFNSRIDTQTDDEWSVEKVLEVIINNCRFWRGEGMKMFVQLRFTYEQESRPEEFFLPYVWQLILFRSGFAFDPSSINLFPISAHDINDGVETEKLQNSEMNEEGLQAA
ncbi:dyggve-melchior-clausen syndrome protein [Perilla frutescens var. frutescens]|nr:dyggve-melchior-clausen syndrome protein [Perilla frutescens var. frutescens]